MTKFERLTVKEQNAVLNNKLDALLTVLGGMNSRSSEPVKSIETKLSELKGTVQIQLGVDLFVCGVVVEGRLYFYKNYITQVDTYDDAKGAIQDMLNGLPEKEKKYKWHHRVCHKGLTHERYALIYTTEKLVPSDKDFMVETNNHDPNTAAFIMEDEMAEVRKELERTGWIRVWEEV